MVVRYLERSRIVAPPGWSRWLVPPAALSIHLTIGQAYAWSVFKRPLETSLGISGVASALPFTLGIVMLGASAALFGTRVDRNGPRWAMFVSMCCFCSGFLIWFPDRPGLATGIAIMGFGGGALIASPWSNSMLTAFGATGAQPDPGGIATTFLIHGLVYAVFMSMRWLLIRVPAPEWKPNGGSPRRSSPAR